MLLSVDSELYHQSVQVQKATVQKLSLKAASLFLKAISPSIPSLIGTSVPEKADLKLSLFRFFFFFLRHRIGYVFNVFRIGGTELEWSWR